MAWKITRTQQAGALGLMLLLLIPPVSSSVSTGLVLEPGASAHIRAEVPGQLQAVYVKSGDTVRTGQLLAVLAESGPQSRSGIAPPGIGSG